MRDYVGILSFKIVDDVVCYILCDDAEVFGCYTNFGVWYSDIAVIQEISTVIGVWYSSPSGTLSQPYTKYRVATISLL